MSIYKLNYLNQKQNAALSATIHFEINENINRSYIIAVVKTNNSVTNVCNDFAGVGKVFMYDF